MMMIVSNDGEIPEEEITNNASTNKGNSAASYTWVFYVLGAIGVLGGGFLIARLRKKVRAA